MFFCYQHNPRHIIFLLYDDLVQIFFVYFTGPSKKATDITGHHHVLNLSNIKFMIFYLMCTVVTDYMNGTATSEFLNASHKYDNIDHANQWSQVLIVYIIYWISMYLLVEVQGRKWEVSHFFPLVFVTKW
ncbi:hypothetical protein BDC45DRAFT_537631 [Circinella umbellata]|nr:hypothetical protein BDC45DRAFT_537631 [Circinella umbellata]